MYFCLHVAEKDQNNYITHREVPEAESGKAGTVNNVV